MAPHYPFYGLEPHEPAAGEPYLTSVEEMAVHYLARIREVQPEGPYYLGGVGLGGLVAYEMAQLLRKQEQKIALLAMINVYNYHGVRMHLSLRQRLTSAEQKIFFHLSNLARLRPKQRLKYLSAIKTVAQRGQIRRAGVGVSRAKTEQISKDAYFAYVPRPYPEKVTMFRPSKNFSYLSDPQLGWGGVITGPIDWIELPVLPGGILIEPYVETLAQRLKERIDASAEEPRQAPQEMAAPLAGPARA
jgi:thioesterase domain-containing protein